MNKKIIITLDGPAGSGKTTISKRVAEKLNLKYIDTGALYRGIAYELNRSGIDIESDLDISRNLGSLNFEFRHIQNELKLFSLGKDISGFIRTPEISMLASKVSAYKVVRNFLLETQRKLGCEKNVIFEGRDTGTVIFPKADFKFFLTASVETRARRRFLELGTDSGQMLKDVERDIRERDNNDINRDIAPLKKAADAVEIDTSEMSINDVVNSIIEKVKNL